MQNRIFMIFLLSIFTRTISAERDVNRISAFGSVWPFMMAVHVEAGVTYERLLSELWSVTGAAAFENFKAPNHHYWGAGAQVGTQFMLYSVKEEPFTQGIVAGLSSGLMFGEDESHRDVTNISSKKNKVWVPVSLSLHYLHSFENNVFLTGGLKSQLFQMSFPYKIHSWAYPRLEVGAGYAF